MGQGQAKRAYFQQYAGIHDVAELFTGQFGDYSASVGIYPDKALRFQLAKSLPNRYMADA